MRWFYGCGALMAALALAGCGASGPPRSDNLLDPRADLTAHDSCPYNVRDAAIKVGEAADGATLTITATSPTSVAAIQRRAKHLAKGGGCPTLMSKVGVLRVPGATLNVASIPSGAVLAVAVTDPNQVQLVRTRAGEVVTRHQEDQARRAAPPGSHKPERKPPASTCACAKGTPGQPTKRPCACGHQHHPQRQRPCGQHQPAPDQAKRHDTQGKKHH